MPIGVSNALVARMPYESDAGSRRMRSSSRPRSRRDHAMKHPGRGTEFTVCDGMVNRVACLDSVLLFGKHPVKDPADCNVVVYHNCPRYSYDLAGDKFSITRSALTFLEFSLCTNSRKLQNLKRSKVKGKLAGAVGCVRPSK